MTQVQLPASWIVAGHPAAAICRGPALSGDSQHELLAAWMGMHRLTQATSAPPAAYAWSALRATLVMLVVGPLVAGCTGGRHASEGNSQPASVRGPVTSARSGPPIRYQPCQGRPAAHTTTNLRPVARIDETKTADPFVGRIPLGTVRLEHAGDLVLTDGQLMAGSGFDAATGTEQQKVRVAREPITAPVTLAVLDTAKGGGGVAFVEVRIKSNPPVSWEEENLLGIGTDTADGGFWSGAAAPSVADEQTMNGYLDAINAFELPNGKGPNVCVVGGAAGGVVDRVLFSIGYDGGYPTFVGRDAQGDIASVVSFLYLLPWSYSGLPGKAPAFDTAAGG